MKTKKNDAGGSFEASLPSKQLNGRITLAVGEGTWLDFSSIRATPFVCYVRSHTREHEKDFLTIFFFFNEPGKFIVAGQSTRRSNTRARKQEKQAESVTDGF